MNKYYVIKRDTCPECDGIGIIVHPLWRKLYDETMGEFMNHYDIDRWFRGYGYDKPPREEVSCGYCGGNGFIDTEVPLEEALSELLSLPNFLEKGD